MENFTEIRVELAWLRTCLGYKTRRQLLADDAAFAECGRVYSSESLDSYHWRLPLIFGA